MADVVDLLLSVADSRQIPTTRMMKTFDEFKASREKMDLSTRQMSEHQWRQAYAAYCNARENTRGARSSSSKDGSHRRRSSSQSSGKGMHAPSTLSASAALKVRVRADSAYADLRLIVNLLSWVLIGVIVIVAILQGVLSSMPAVTGVALLSGAIQAVAVILLRLIVHVIIDIPDVALYRACEEQKATSASASD